MIYLSLITRCVMVTLPSASVVCSVRMSALSRFFAITLKNLEQDALFTWIILSADLEFRDCLHKLFHFLITLLILSTFLKIQFSG